MIKLGSATLLVGGVLATGTAIAVAAPPAAKVTICHRTASHTNPYVRITVAQHSVDGDLANDKGQGDHYLEHLGPVGPVAEGEWGDIVPPIAGVHGGRNWDAAGIAVYSAGCGTPAPTTTSATTSSTTTTIYAT